MDFFSIGPAPGISYIGWPPNEQFGISYTVCWHCFLHSIWIYREYIPAIGALCGVEKIVVEVYVTTKVGSLLLELDMFIGIDCRLQRLIASTWSLMLIMCGGQSKSGVRMALYLQWGNYISGTWLTRWGRNRVADMLQTFSWMKMVIFLFKFNWILLVKCEIDK